MDNKRSHDIIEKSLEMLRRLNHRGGVGADGITGDGAGIMTEIPYQLFEQLTEFKVPRILCRGIIFLKRKLEIQFTKRCLINIFESEGFKVIGYRDVPVDTRAIAQHVADTMPYIQQVFVDITGVK